MASVVAQGQTYVDKDGRPARQGRKILISKVLLEQGKEAEVVFERPGGGRGNRMTVKNLLRRYRLVEAEVVEAEAEAEAVEAKAVQGAGA